MPTIYAQSSCPAPEKPKATVEQDLPDYPKKFKVTLSWNPVEEAEFYSVYFHNDAMQNIWLGDVYTNSFEQGLDVEGEFRFTVTTHCMDGSVSEHSVEYPVVIEDNGGNNEGCLAPTGLGFDVETDVEGYDYKYKVTLKWDAVEGADYYDVYVNGGWFGYSTTNFYITGTNNPGSFEFSVLTVCNDGNSSDLSTPYTVVIEETSLTELNNKIDIFPNPVSDNLTVLTTENINEINIYNIVGINIYNDKSFTGGNIDVSNLNNGVYFVKINTDKGDIVKRFIKE